MIRDTIKSDGFYIITDSIKIEEGVWTRIEHPDYNGALKWNLNSRKDVTGAHKGNIQWAE